MKHDDLLQRLHEAYQDGALLVEQPEQVREDFEKFVQLLEEGELRSATQTEEGKWEANQRVKEGILIGFKLGKLIELEQAGSVQHSELDTYPPQRFDIESRRLRIVPGGNSIRRGSYVGEGVIMMPPAFVNVGAYVGEGTLIDSHALVGSCAQVGKRVHLSAGVQIGGVLEPIGQTPVIIEDGALIGGNSGLYEGIQVGERAVIGAGCVMTAATPLYDLVKEEVYRAKPGNPLRIPNGAVVVPGSRPAKGAFAEKHGLQVAACLIIKYRDERTDSKTELEDLLRGE